MSDEPSEDGPEVTAWQFGGAIPQRFSTNYSRYLALGGQVDITGDARAYAGTDPNSRRRTLYVSKPGI